MTRLEKSSQTLLMSLAHSMQSRPFSTKLSPKRTLTLQASQSDEPRIGGMMHGSMVLQMRAPPSTQSRMAALGRRLRSETLTAEGGHPTTSLHHHDSVRLVTIFRDGNQLGPISTKRESARSGCMRLRPGKVASTMQMDDVSCGPRTVRNHASVNAVPDGSDGRPCQLPSSGFAIVFCESFRVSIRADSVMESELMRISSSSWLS